MDVSHIMVGGLTAISVALLVWIELRSRRNAAGQEQKAIPEANMPAEHSPRRRT
jgi:hypothetical protein